MSEDRPITRLPLFSAAKVKPLAPVPGQPDDVHYALADIATWAPNGAEGLGYVVEQLPDKRTVRVLAWIRAGSAVWPCERPLARQPVGDPLLRVCNMRDSTSHGLVVDQEGDTMAEWSDCPIGPGRYLRSCLLPEGPGAYGDPQAHLDLATLTAAGYLIYREAQRRARVSATGPGVLSDPLASLAHDPLPDALDQVVWDGNPSQSGAAPLLRYAARSLELAGAAQVRRIAAQTGADAVRLGPTRLWWLRFPASAVGPEDRATLLAVEAALNRTVLAQERLQGTPGITDALVDQAAFSCLADFVTDAASLAKGYEQNNPLASYRGALGERGGEWDLRTRFSRASERLRLPFRLEQRFDCDPASGLAAIECATPPFSAFPCTRFADGRVTDCSAEAPGMAARYAVRLAATLAACAFGSSLAVTRVAVTVFGGDLGGEPVLSVDFGRLPFNRVTLPAMRDGTLARPYEPEALATLLGQPVRMSYVPGSGLAPVEPFRLPQLAERRIEVWQDQRPLPEALRSHLRADRVCELDVYHDELPDLLAEVRAVDSEERDSPIVAVMRLEEAAAQAMEHLSKKKDGLEGRHPLYCNSGLARLLVAGAPGPACKATGLEAAEDPTQVSNAASSSPLTEGSRYYQLPDALQEAKIALARRYFDLGDTERALATIEQCIALAPSSCPSRITKSVMLGDLERFHEAAEELTVLLTMLIDTEDTGFVFYRLAFALWQTGQAPLGAACYVFAMATPRFADQSRTELNELLSEARIPEPTWEEAEAQLKAAGICVPQRPELLDSLATSAVGLVDAGCPQAAWRVVNYLADHFHNDDLHNLGASLRDGTPSAYLQQS